MNGRSSNSIIDEDRVTFIAQEDDSRFKPQVVSLGSHRAFEPEDISRVLDFEGVIDAPADGPLLFGEENSGNMSFPSYHFCLRGGYLFYFRSEDVDEDSGPYAIFLSAPLGVVPLEGVTVEFPPGGRRVFREHATTNARNGYEMVVLHVPNQTKNNATEDAAAPETMRPPMFLVADSLGQREKWSKALKERAAIRKPTMLRAGYKAGSSSAAAKNAAAAAAASASAASTKTQKYHDDGDVYIEAAAPVPPGGTSSNPFDTAAVASGAAAAAAAAAANPFGDGKENKDKSRNKSGSTKTSSSNKRGQGDKTSSLSAAHGSLSAQGQDAQDDAELASAVVEFGALHFDEKVWMDEYFSIRNDFDAPSKCRAMEHFQSEMKKSLKGAVLEQYEYFVQASGEMTTMGREVSTLKALIETQLDTIKDMKEVDFSSAVNIKLLEDCEKDAVVDNDNNNNNIGETDGDNKDLHTPHRGRDDDSYLDDEKSIFSEVSDLISIRRGSLSSQQQADGGGGRGGSNNANNNNNTNVNDSTDDAPPIQVPEWLDDVEEEIGAIAREGRYQDAVELHTKARNEVADLIDKHERPTLYKLTKKQLLDLKCLLKALDQLGRRICSRLEETLRRKNEALRQASKRERSDPNNATHAMNSGTVAAVSPCAIHDDAHYLKLLCRLGRAQVAAEAYAARRSLLLLEALSERPISGAGAVDLVIYAAQLSQSFFSCLANSVEGFLDLFLTSVSSAHGGDSRNHANEDDSLADSSVHSQSMKNAVPSGAVASVVLWCDAELAKFASAFGGTRILANLALSPPPRSDAPKKPRVVGVSSLFADDQGTKDRKNAIDVAAQCIDQAFLYATQNLDSVGLPLAPRLAEYIRVRLKGCEDEVSQLMDERWQHLTVDWRIKIGNGSTAANGTAYHQNGR